MKTIFTFLFLVWLTTISTAQQSEQAFLEASAEKGAQEFFYKNSRATSGGYTYVAGASINDDGNYDMLLTKYNGATEVWSVVWNGTNDGDDYAADVVVDGSGNIIICGTTEITSINYNAVVAKYNSSGTLQWASTYAGSANLGDGFISLEKDNSNNIYACGGTQTTSEFVNYLTVKYNSSGTQQWASTYDYADLYDGAVKLVVSGSTVRASGGTQIDATDWQMTTVSYNTSTGAQEGVQHTGGDDEGVDTVTDAWTDGTYTYVVGAVRNTSTGLDWKVLKLDANLTVVWSATYNGSANQDDQAQCVKVDASGNVYVTGWATVTGEGRNFVTRKYNSSGTVQWTSSFNETTEVGNDEALTLEIDNTANILVSGSSYKNGNKDYFTIKYKYTDGAEVWRSRFNSDYNDDDVPSNIALDDAGNIYVIGTSGKGNGTNTYMMCKYVVKTIYVPVPTDEYAENGYIENRSQIRNTNGTVNTSVKYYNDRSYPATYIDDSKISYVFGVLYPDSAVNDTLHRVDMKFNKGVHNAKVYSHLEQDYYTNFYLGYMTKNGARVYDNNTVVKLGVYTNSDVIFTQNNIGYKHWIVARSGAPTADFEMQYDGQSSLSVDGNGDLVIGTVLGNFVQPKAKVYTLNHTTGALTLLGWQPTYTITGGNKVSFTSLGSWSGTLVIEMMKGTMSGGGFPPIDNLRWSTYVGNTQGDQYYGVTVWSDFQYACGGSESPQFPVTEGAFQEGQLGDRNPVWSKFRADHFMEYSTYFGGTAGEGAAQDIFVRDGVVYICGYTDAPNLWIEEVDGADNDNTLGGLLDAFVARFNSDGFPTWSRYIGGSGFNDRAMGIYVDADGIWLSGQTGAESGFPFADLGGDTYFIDTPEGSVDAFVMKIGNDLTIDWSTRYGGESVDVARQMIRDFNGRIWVSGDTHSSDFPSSTSTGLVAADNALGGDVDDFIVRFAPSGVVEWSSYIGGSDVEWNLPEGVPKLSIAPNSNVFFCGTTASTDLPTVFSSSTWDDDVHGGDDDGYILQFDYNTMAAEWATYVGSSEQEMINGCHTNEDSGLFVVGQSGSSDIPLIPVSDAYYQQESTPVGNGFSLDDAFILHYTPALEADWFTYWGGTSFYQGEKPQDLYVGNDLLYIVGATDQEYLDQLGTGDVNIPLVDFGGDSYFDEIYNGEYEDAFICMFDIDIITPVEEWTQNEQQHLLNVYPSPAAEFVNIAIHPSLDSPQMFVISDISGRIVLSDKWPSHARFVRLDISNLSSGIYTVDVLLHSTKVGVSKFQKQ